jgi:hypothetical protein
VCPLGTPQPVLSGALRYSNNPVNYAIFHEEEFPESGNSHAAAEYRREVIEGSEGVNAPPFLVQNHRYKKSKREFARYSHKNVNKRYFKGLQKNFIISKNLYKIIQPYEPVLPYKLKIGKSVPEGIDQGSQLQRKKSDKPRQDIEQPDAFGLFEIHCPLLVPQTSADPQKCFD